jgi:hypothetical protein
MATKPVDSNEAPLDGKLTETEHDNGEASRAIYVDKLGAQWDCVRTTMKDDRGKWSGSVFGAPPKGPMVSVEEGKTLIYGFTPGRAIVAADGLHNLCEAIDDNVYGWVLTHKSNGRGGWAVIVLLAVLAYAADRGKR